MEESKNPHEAVSIPDTAINPEAVQNQAPYPSRIIFKMKDGSSKSFNRTERHLGKGGQANVYFATDDEGQEYVIKIFDLSMQKEGEKRNPRKEFQRESNLLQKVDSPYVIKYYGETSDPDNDRYCLLLEYCNFDLQKLIDNRKLVNKSGIFPEEQARKIVDNLF